MAAAGWTPTGESYLARVTKARILEAVREAKGDEAADRIAGLKKPEMVAAAEELLEGTGWLPEVLRMPVLPDSEAQSAENGGESAMGDSAVIADDEPVTGDAFATAAE
jgi:ParB family chromosome partitioning protein